MVWEGTGSAAQGRLPKSAAVKELLDRLGHDMPAAFTVDDRWGGDPHAVSIVTVDDPAKLLYLAASDGSYTYECQPRRLGDVPHHGEFACTARSYSEVLAAVRWLTGPRGANPPPSFDEHWSDEWGAWVLANGFPPFPDVLLKGHAVPVARHAGHHMGSVLFFEWHWGHDDPDDDEPETNFITFRRTGNGWVDLGDGGGWGPVDIHFAPFETGHCMIGQPIHYAGHHMTAIGMVTPAAALLELEQHGATHVSPIVAPLNLITVTAESSAIAVARVLDSSGNILATTTLLPQWTP